MRLKLTILWMARITLALGTLTCLPRPAFAYSLLTHEQLIDLTWDTSIAPMIRKRYPDITARDLERARAYAYGGCVIQDIGYYPFGDRFYSDLTHYVRSGDFVVNLFREAHSADELAFAIGALSHYVGDTVGHAEATNLAVPIEFPKLGARYGKVVPYADGEHAHVQTEFAFDINEVGHHRFAPQHYLQHVGLEVPVRQLAMAYYRTYGMDEDFTDARKRRINVRGYRFAVHSFLPRIAYALTLLHRHDMPPDTANPDFVQLQAELTQVSRENAWDAYRKKPGIGTYSLAGFLYILPKVGPLKLLAIKGPTVATEDRYIHSVNQSVATLNATLTRFSNPHETLPNRDLDTGARTRPGAYPLTDETYAVLLDRLASNPTQPVPPGLKADIEEYYADPSSPILTKKYPAAWARVQADLKVLQTMPVSNQPLSAETK